MNKANLATMQIAFNTILRREMRRFMRLWVQTILPSAITMALYFMIFGNLIGPRIGEMQGHNYIDYIVPGLIMMAIITNSYGNIVASFFGAKFQRSIEELLIAPVPVLVILAGYIAGAVARGFIVGLAVVLVSLFFTDLQVHHFGVIIGVALLTAILFSLAGFINAIFAQKFDDINLVPTFVLTPLTYLGGVFYSADLLSPFWRSLTYLNPVFYMVNAFRYGFLGESDIAIATALWLILAFVIVLFAVSYYLLEKGVGIRS